MKSTALNIKKTILAIFLFFSAGAVFSQSAIQAHDFINRSHVSVAKVEKEMFKANDNTNGPELKNAIKYQLIAVKLYQEKNYKDAVGYSYKARTICMELCTKMNISEGAWYALNDSEKVYCKPELYTNLHNVNLLSPEETNKVDNLDVLDVQKFHAFELGIYK